MTNIIGTITIEIQTPETIKEINPSVRAEFTTAIGEAYSTLDAMGKFNRSNGARTIVRSVVTAELADNHNFILQTLQNCKLELGQLHTLHYKECSEGCPTLIYIADCEKAIRLMEGKN